jgi:two-component system, NtrC family, response regulator
MYSTRPSILVIDDSSFERTLMCTLLKRRTDYNCIEVSNAEDALTLILSDSDHTIAAAILDLSMPDVSGQELLPRILSIRPDLGVIVVTGSQSTTDVVTMIKMGAADYLVKPAHPDVVINSLSRIVHLHTMRQEIERLKSRDQESPNFTKLIGQHSSLKNSIKLAAKAAQSDITVLITGESGVGKEIMARAIHNESSRKDAPFIAVNCGALPKDLVESTLFGHKKGSTGKIP